LIKKYQHHKKRAMKKIIQVITCMLLMHCCICNAQSEKSIYKIANKFSIEGDGGWDYLIMDDSTGRIFVSHGMVTQVVDAKTGKLTGTVPDTKGVHGIALARDENKAFISCGRDSTISIVNLQTLELIAKIKSTGANPDAILYDSFTHRVFAFNGRTSNATVIDAKTNAVIETIPLEGKPEFAVTDGNGKVYVNIEDKSLITVINPTTLKTEQSWSVSPGVEPSGLALDKAGHRLFSVCDNKLMVIVDAQSGKVITSLPIGERVDGTAYDPLLKRAYSSNGEGTLTVVQEENPNSFKVLENVTTQKGARTITIDKKTHHIYLPTAEYGETPAATTENPHPRPAIKPGTFVILDIEPGK
jgi:YVTN family beta-propeller protein